jgi:hypothetical protein
VIDHDHHRGDAVAPRRRGGADAAVARHADPRRRRLPVSGERWITIIPRSARVVVVSSINLLGDRLREALNPRLR